MAAMALALVLVADPAAANEAPVADAGPDRYLAAQPVVLDVLDRQKRCAADGIPVVVGGIIPEDDAAKLLDAGVKRVYTPKDFDLNRIMGEIVDVVAEANTGA